MKAISLPPGYDLAPTSTQDASLLDRIARQEVESRRYVLSDNITPGLGYDDRLTRRLGLSKNTIKKYVNNGTLLARKLEGKIIMSEAAVRHFLAPVLCVDTLPGLTGKVNLAQLSQVESKHLPAHAVRLAPEQELCPAGRTRWCAKSPNWPTRRATWCTRS